MKKISCLIVLAFLHTSLHAQVELQKIAPLSPNAASIVKFDEIPVGHFTGAASVIVPVYNIQSRSLSLPLALSYHGSGNKVEDIASWVGLGWSLGSLPSLARDIRGLPDEEYQGVVVPYGSYDITEIAAVLTCGTVDCGPYIDFVCQILDRQLDIEADLYSFSLPGKSGKFYWDHKAQKYQCNPWSNIKLTPIGSPAGSSFRITDEDGTIYEFGDHETTQSQGTGMGPVQKTSWVISKIYNANKTDSLAFTYSTENQSTTTINPGVHGIFATCPDLSPAFSTSHIVAKVLSQIDFAGGSIVFTRDTAQRLDLYGGYRLKEIVVNNAASTLVNKISFGYSYLNATGFDPYCNALSTTQENKRLLLRTVTQSGSGGGTGDLVHSFFYDTITTSPCRVSSAQDFWGYHNGASSNQDLVPESPNPFSSGFVPGAKRYVNPDYNQFGILKKIQYPTGGTTEFVYEPNEVYNNNLPGHFISRSAYLQGEAPFPITTNTYIDTFLISNPSDFYVNKNLGGVFADIDFGYLGCAPGGSCAQLFLKGLDASNSSVNLTISTVSQGFHLPNGSYEMKAVFNQTPPAYDEFYFLISWRDLDTTIANRYVGGVRIKEVISTDSVSNQVRKLYQYTSRLSSDTSSGNLFGPPNLIKYSDFYCSANYNYRILSQSHATAVSHSGGYAGYQTVFEKTDSALTQGVTEYKFSTIHDDYQTVPPYVPATSLSEFRGQPIQITQYKKQGSDLIPVSRIMNEYSTTVLEQDTIISMRFFPTSNEECTLEYPGLGPVNGYLSHYYNYPVVSRLLKSVQRSYNPSDTTKFIETVTINDYNSRYQLSETKFVNSQGDTIRKRYYYPPDLSLTGSAETARQALVTQNSVSTVLKQESYNNVTLTSEIKTNYKHFGTQVMPEEIFQKIETGSSESRIKFLKYTSDGKLVSQQKTDDILQSYIWDYNSTLPIAECVNADSASIAATSFEADGKGGWTYAGTTTVDVTSPTGNKCYLVLSNPITKSGLVNATYIVSYWGRNNSASVNSSGPTRTGKTVGNWTYYEHEVTGTSITITGGEYIDELRLFPVGSLMNSYTYNPLVGITSQCDPTGRITYYEYDSFSRLKLVKDQDKNVIKVIDYQYKQTQNQ